MQKVLFLALGVGLAAVAAPTLTAAPRPATLAASPAALVSLDLTRYGAPLTMQVPAEAKAKAFKEGVYGPAAILIEAPHFRMLMLLFQPPTLTAKKQIDLEVNSVIRIGDDNVVLREPLAFRTKSKSATGGEGFGVAVDNPATGYCYYLRPEQAGFESFSTVEIDAMLASARTAKLSPAANARK